MYGSGMEGSQGQTCKTAGSEFQTVVDRFRKETEVFNELISMVESKANQLYPMGLEPAKPDGPAPRLSGVIGTLHESADVLSSLNNRLNRVHQHLEKCI